MNIRHLLVLLLGISTLFHRAFATDALGERLIIGGTSNSLDSSTSGVIGSGNTLSASPGSLLVGNFNSLTGVAPYSASNFLFGDSNEGSDMSDNFVSGIMNAVSGGGTGMVVGYMNYASPEEAIVVGENNYVSGPWASVIGMGLIYSYGSNLSTLPAARLIIGSYNNQIADPIFVIGNGVDATHRHNAMEITQDGKISLSGTSSTTPTIVLDPNTSQITVGGQPLATSVSTGMQSFTAPSFSFNSASVNRLTIDASGNVGIGTATPAADLHVSKSQNGQTMARIENSNTGNAAQALLTVVSNGGGGGLYSQGSAFTSTPIFQANGMTVYSAASSSAGLTLATGHSTAPIRFVTGGYPGSEKMRIDSAGNVGIGTGTAALTAKLQLVGNASIVGTTAMNGNAVVTGTATINGTAAINGAASMGTGVAASTSGQVVLGKYNDTRTAEVVTSGTSPLTVNHTQGLLIVGSGTGTATASRSNALRVLDDGTIVIKKAGDIDMGDYHSGQTP